MLKREAARRLRPIQRGATVASRYQQTACSSTESWSAVPNRQGQWRLSVLASSWLSTQPKLVDVQSGSAFKRAGQAGRSQSSHLCYGTRCEITRDASTFYALLKKMCFPFATPERGSRIARVNEMSGQTRG